MISRLRLYYGNKKRKISDRITTYGLFIDPPLGRVGMTKSEAEKQGFVLMATYQ
jgi:pyruvate/2-oxoglutarate dehydrogenase complex dihydrolipoamide dehydrogenase (E3) component